MVINIDTTKEEYDVINYINNSMGKIDENLSGMCADFNVDDRKKFLINNRIAQVNLDYHLIGSSKSMLSSNKEYALLYKIDKLLSSMLCTTLLKRREVNKAELNKDRILHIVSNEPYTIMAIGFTKHDDTIDPDNLKYKAVLINFMIKKSWFDQINADLTDIEKFPFYFEDNYDFNK